VEGPSRCTVSFKSSSAQLPVTPRREEPSRVSTLMMTVWFPDKRSVMCPCFSSARFNLRTEVLLRIWGLAPWRLVSMHSKLTRDSLWFHGVNFELRLAP